MITHKTHPVSNPTTTPPPATLWIWYWQGGGYNSTRAHTRAAALRFANRMHPACVVDEGTLHVGTEEELRRLYILTD